MFFPMGNMRPWRDEMPGTPTVWAALPMPSRPDPESFQELGADAWRSQGLKCNLEHRKKHLL